MTIDTSTRPPHRTYKHIAQDLRAAILELDHAVVEVRKDTKEIDRSWNRGLDVDEMLANITLAHRHLEDARMRLGKFIQAFDGGTSVYDQVPGD
jgi:hypothetical protein